MLRDLHTPEQDGLFIETLGQCIRGTVLCVVADNLTAQCSPAHGLAGFVQSFFSEAELNVRTKACHDNHVQNAVQGENATHFGIKCECALSKALQHFDLITGFLSDILHDLFEGIVLNFPYQHADRLDKPQVIPKKFAAKLSIGRNGHENCTLLRLFPYYYYGRR